MLRIKEALEELMKMSADTATRVTYRASLCEQNNIAKFIEFGGNFKIIALCYASIYHLK